MVNKKDYNSDVLILNMLFVLSVTRGGSLISEVVQMCTSDQGSSVNKRHVNESFVNLHIKSMSYCKCVNDLSLLKWIFLNIGISCLLISADLENARLH